MSYDHFSEDTAYAAEASEAFKERRRAPRVPVIKSAKITVETGDYSGTFDCLVLDESRYGVLAELGTILELPEQLELEVDGVTHRARRVWTAGSKVGLEFIGVRMSVAEVKLRMAKIADTLKSDGLPAAMEMLRGEGFLDLEALRNAAEAAEEAYRRFDAMLLGPGGTR